MTVYEEEGKENVKEAVEVFLESLETPDRFLNYVDMNVCEKLYPFLPKSLFPYFCYPEYVSETDAANKESEGVKEIRNRDEKKKEDKRNKKRAKAFKKGQNREKKS